MSKYDVRIGFIFSDRFWLIKVAIALAAFSYLCRLARNDYADLTPEVERVPAFFDTQELRGRIVQVAVERIVTVRDDGFDVDTEVGPFHVLSTNPPPNGSLVTLRARVVGPRTLEAIAWRKHEAYRLKRIGLYGVSIASVVGFAWLVRRRFRWNPERGLFRSRY